MPDLEYCRLRADALLREAAQASNLRERGRLIDEAIHWHNLALNAAEHDRGEGEARRTSDEQPRK